MLNKYTFQKELKLKDIGAEIENFLTQVSLAGHTAHIHKFSILRPGDSLDLDDRWTLTQALLASGLIAPAAPDTKPWVNFKVKGTVHLGRGARYKVVSGNADTQGHSAVAYDGAVLVVDPEDFGKLISSGAFVRCED